MYRRHSLTRDLGLTEIIANLRDVQRVDGICYACDHGSRQPGLVEDSALRRAAVYSPQTTSSSGNASYVEEARVVMFLDDGEEQGCVQQRRICPSPPCVSGSPRAQGSCGASG
jgi:hypothetical protein